MKCKGHLDYVNAPTVVLCKSHEVSAILARRGNDLLKEYFSIDLVTSEGKITLASQDLCCEDEVSGHELILNFGTVFRIKLASFGGKELLELRDLQWGLLLLINNEEYALYVEKMTDSFYSVINKPERLKILIISGKFKDDYPRVMSVMTGLEELHLWAAYSLSDISFLKSHTGLKKLSLKYCDSLSDISGISSLANLTELNLKSSDSLEDISPVSSLKKLEKLNISWCDNLLDFSPIACLVKLKELDISYCINLRDLSFIENLPNLQSLNLESCSALRDISLLSNMTNLEELNLSSCKLENLSLCKMTNLTCLQISNVDCFSDLNQLSPLTKLAKLAIDSNQNIYDLSPLSKFNSLKELSLSNCSKITNIAPIGSLSQLEKLDLSDCENLVKVQELTHCQNLIELDCSGSGNIRDFTELAEVPNLRLAKWTEKATSSYVVMASAYKRKDIELIRNNLPVWIENFTLAKNPREYAERLVKSCITLRNDDLYNSVINLIKKQLRLT